MMLAFPPVLPRWHSGKESACQYRRHKRWGFDPWVGKTPGEGNGNPLQYSCLENSMDRGACRATVHGVAKESDMTEQLSMHRMGTLREGNGEGCGTLAVARNF